MFNRENLFGNRQPPPPGQRPPERRPLPTQDNRRPEAYDHEPKGYSETASASGRRIQLRPAKSPDSCIWANVCAVSPQDIPSQDGGDVYLLVNGHFVVSARPMPGFERGRIGLNDIQRTWMQVALTDVVEAELYDPFRQGAKGYLGSLDIEIGFATSKKTTDAPFDQDELATAVTQTFRNQIFAPGQSLLLDFRGIKLKLTVKTVELVDLTLMKVEGSVTQQTSPQARGILTPESVVHFFKDAKSPIALKASARRPNATSVIRPDFKFEDMGIGGLDKEFSDIFRRAFQSRLMPAALVEELGITHVRGMLLFGPPGTGKTLIARQIGKMLNAREPKVINGPEVLNKYVGQSEENVRKLFADAEKEQKEKGDQSELHIIIFDELDAVCKQRGSGAGGGTGVGDSVVNQLLSKLDGVEQLNNILLIGMTNRKDMIDEALLRAGRLEVHMEIGLPDEHGRQQILNIHTANIRKSGRMASDVDLAEIARLTRNYSGAEIAGLLKSASSFAVMKYNKGGSSAALADNVMDVQICMEDFLRALDEVKPLFGVSEEDLQSCLEGGIFPYGPQINRILAAGSVYVEQVRTGTSRLLSVLLHGPQGSGKTALAAQIALASEFPMIKLVRAVDMMGMNEIQKIQHLSKIFTDAYKSSLSLLVLDSIEQMIDWTDVGPRFSTAILSALKGFIGNKPPKERMLLILATTSERTAIQQLKMSFDAQIPVPNLRTLEELAHVMNESGQFDPPGIERAVREIEATMGSRTVNVGMKQILQCIKDASMQKQDRVGAFVERICESISEANPSYEADLS